RPSRHRAEPLHERRRDLRDRRFCPRRRRKHANCTNRRRADPARDPHPASPPAPTLPAPPPAPAPAPASAPAPPAPPPPPPPPPAAISAEYPANHVSFDALLVPVFPATGKRSSRARAPVPWSTTLPRRLVTTYASGSSRTRRAGGGVLSSTSRPSWRTIFVT